MKRIFYISNAYPSKNDNYAVFCKTTHDFINNSDSFKISIKELIKGKSNNKIFNVFRYMKLLIMIYIKSFILFRLYDYIYIQYVWMHAYIISFIFPLYKYLKKKIIINFHGEDLTEYEKLNIIFKSLFHKICKESNIIIVPSDYFKRKLLLIDNNNKNILVSPSGGINTKIFNKNTLRMPRNKIPEIIFCSRFDKEKGWDDFINGIFILKNYFKINCVAEMIGYGCEINMAKKLIRDKKLELVINLIENASQYQMQEIYSKSDIFIFPTRRLAESLGLVALEAMSCGLPVIGSDSGALPEYIFDGYNGFMFKKGDAHSLAVKIQHYIQLKNEEKQRLSDNAYNTSRKYFDIVVEKELIQNIKKFC